MAFSIYELDDDIRRLLNLDNFLEGLSIPEFVEELSKDHILKGAEVNKLEYLDPKPYIRTFESTLKELDELRKHANRRREDAEKKVDDFELKHSENVLELSSKVDSVTKKFDSLDVKISGVSLKIDPLGQLLNKITNSRDRSTETIFLIRAYHGFYTKDKYDPLEYLRTSNDYDDRVKCAKTVNNLLTLAKKIEAPEFAKTAKCVKTIEKFAETMELDLLESFRTASKDDDYAKMREVTNILFQFNGGATVVQVFVNEHEVLLDDGLSEENPLLDDEAFWTKLSDPNYGDTVQDEATKTSLEALRVSIKGQARIIREVFEDTTPVLKILFQRIYAQIIQNRIGTLLQYSLSVLTLAHIRILHALYVLVSDFTNDIKEFLSANDLDKNNELALILDQSNFDLFIEYLSDDTYLSREKKTLEETVYNFAHGYNVYHEAALNNKYLTTRLENLDNLELKNKTQSQDNRFSFHFLEKKRINQFTTYMKTHIADRVPRKSVDNDEPDYSEDAQLDVAKVGIVVKSAIESIARILELAQQKTPEYSLEILEILLFDFGKLYIGAGLEVAYDTLKHESASLKAGNFPNLSFLAAVGLTSEFLFLLSSCIKKIILPCAVNVPNIKNRMTGLTNTYISRCEISINIIVNETIEFICQRVANALAKQKKRDFVRDNISEDDTESCEEVAAFLTYCYEELLKYLNSTNLHNVLVKIGLNVLNQLLEHYKKFSVNSTGGIILTKDVITYQSVIDHWQIPELSENFQLLKEIANLFTVHPNLINSLVTEGQLANLKPYTIRQYISKRSDFNPSYLERFFSFK